MRRRSKRCSEKTSDAQVAKTGRELGDEGQGLLAAPCLCAGRHRAEELPLSLEAAGRYGDPAAAAGAGVGTSAVRLSTPAHPAAAGRRHAELEEALPALSRGAVDGEEARRPQACARHPGADGDPPRCEPALVAGLRV